MAFACAALQRMSPPRGPRSVLCAAGDLAHPREVDHARVRAGPDGDHLRLLPLRHGRELIVIDQAVVLAHAVLAEIIELAGEVCRVAVRQVAPVAQIHPEHLVTRLQHRRIHREVRLRSGVRLHVRVLRAEQLPSPLDRDVLDLVDVLAAAVPALRRIALGVLVGQHAALRLEDRGIGEVLRRDELDVALLPAKLGGNRGVDLGIEGAKGRGIQHGKWIFDFGFLDF